MSHSKLGDRICSSSFEVRFGWKSLFQRVRWSNRDRRLNGGVGWPGGRQPLPRDQSNFQRHSQIKAEYRQRASHSRRSPWKPAPSNDFESPDEGLPPIAFVVLRRRKPGRAGKRDSDFHPCRRTVLQTELERRREPPRQPRVIHGRIDQHRNASRAGGSKGIL